MAEHATSRSTTVLALLGWVLLCNAAGGLGALLMGDAMDQWYPSLTKPTFNPPGWVFGPVWTTLYTLMGISAWLVWRHRRRAIARTALVIFGAQLLLNAIWSGLFFGLRSPLAGLVDLAALWVLIVLTIIYFARVSKPAAWLLGPYLAWVSFAGVLNAAIWRLNA